MNMEQPNYDPKSLDFTGNNQGKGEEVAPEEFSEVLAKEIETKVEDPQILLEKIVVPGVGVMTLQEAESLISPGKIPGSNIEFSDDYSADRLEELRAEMERYRGLFSETDIRTYSGFIQEIDRRLLIRKALDELKRKSEETIH
ncbi:hypothetical protein K9M47_00140 [Candidatus Gracilibacteria bacterium]|nr:hypothetical protein [Candidatus Gracilibacteria bacterium]MCF7898386.1 hypothetical protein [Candidatus Paceibacterota bacterium]